MQSLDSSVCFKAISLKSISRLQSTSFDIWYLWFITWLSTFFAVTQIWMQFKASTVRCSKLLSALYSAALVSQTGANGEHIYLTVSERNETATKHYIAHLKYSICRVLPQIEKYWLWCSIYMERFNPLTKCAPPGSIFLAWAVQMNKFQIFCTLTWTFCFCHKTIHITFCVAYFGWTKRPRPDCQSQRMSHHPNLCCTSLYTPTPAIKNNIHSKTEVLPWRRRMMAVSKQACSNAITISELFSNAQLYVQR
jgi:hypothetical protein